MLMGMTCRYKLVPDGKRQILSEPVPVPFQLTSVMEDRTLRWWLPRAADLRRPLICATKPFRIVDFFGTVTTLLAPA